MTISIPFETMAVAITSSAARPRPVTALPDHRPWVVAVVVAQTGTTDAIPGKLVMGDELLAMAIQRGIRKHGRPFAGEVRLQEASQAIGGDVDLAFFMHHLPSSPAFASLGHRPAVLWYQNPGSVPEVLLAQAARDVYQVVLHAGMRGASRLHMPHMPFGIEDASLFKPAVRDPGVQSYAVFVGNACMHINSLNLIRHLATTLGPRFVIRGKDWQAANIPSGGPCPVREAALLMAGAAVTFDTVSDAHTQDGMTSTRIYQSLACGTPVVTLQAKDDIPQELWPHMVFANSHEQATEAIHRLLSDTVTRSRMASTARKDALQFAMDDILGQRWPTILRALQAKDAK